MRRAGLILIAWVSISAWLAVGASVGASGPSANAVTGERSAGGVAKAARDDDDDDESEDGDPKPEDLLPVRAVVLVDESGSLDEEAVKRERDAVSIFAETVESDWEVAIFPFGSSNGPGQNAVDHDCPLVKVESEANRQRLRECVLKIKKRGEEEGPDTDHAQALTDAVAELKAAEGPALPVIFLLTDGKLDVERTERYGASDRTATAQRQIDEEILPDAKKNDIQVWPLGFGDVDKAALEKLARGGAQTNPRCPEAAASVPHPVFQPGPNELALAFQEVAASAVCASSTSSEPLTVASGRTEESTHTISAVATSGVLSVVKSNPTSEVEFVDPEGETITSTSKSEGSKFERSGEGTRYEVLRIDGPKPGDWKVKVTAKEGEQTFAMFSQWTGQVDTTVSVPTGTPSPGKESVVTLRLKTYSDQKAPTSALKGFKFAAELSGEDIKKKSIKLADDGKGGDETAGDLIYSGKFTTPKECEAAATLKGSVDASGLAGAVRPFDFSCAVGAQGPEAAVALDDVPEGGVVTAGDELSGTVSFDNPGEPFEAKLSLTGASEGAEISIDPSTADVPSGNSKAEFAIALDPETELGETTFAIEIAGPKDVIVSVDQRLDVNEPPSILPKILLLVLIVLLIAGVAAFAVWRRMEAKQKERRVKGLQALLVEDGEDGRPIAAPVGKREVFSFKINEFGQLKQAKESDGDAYQVRRHPKSPKTKVVVRQPGGEEVEVSINHHIDLDDGDGSGEVDEFAYGGATRRLKIIEKR